MIDLHTHSNISDGNLSPEILVKEAIKQGLTALALTDHDSINGLENARIAAASYNKIDGKAEKFRFITGVELNINWSGGKGVPGIGPGAEFHLLGLGFTPNPAFIAAIDDLSCRREARNRGILEKMYELSMIDDIDGAWRELLAIAGHGLQGNSQSNSLSNSLGRLHFAVFLIKRKLVRNIDQAFARYLGVGKPLFVPKEGLRFDEAAALIRESGGIPVLAHPASLYVAWGRLPDLVKALKDQGLMGIEAWHPTAKPGPCQRLETLAKSLGLYVTEGSDFHGSVRPNHRLGYSNKGRKINAAILEAIPELTGI